MEIYNQLSEEYNKLYMHNIIQFQNNHLANKLPSKYYIDFYPSFGIAKKTECDFLIYGQAPNGWGSGFKLDESISMEKVNNSIEYSNTFLAERSHNPLDWVNVYWSKKTYRENIKTESEKKFYPEMLYRTSVSFFWNVTYKLICDYYDELDRNSFDWSKKIVWSNLYKIAPEKGNPDNAECLCQEEYSVKLIKKEIEEIKPKYCIVLTNGEWWIPFQKGLKTKKIYLEQHESEIDFFEHFNETKIVVTKRPYLGDSDKHVRQILNLIKPMF